MSHDVCPIIEPYLFAVVADPNYGFFDADDHWTFQALRDELPMLPTGPAWVRLRAFLLIEDALEKLRLGYAAYRRSHDLEVNLVLREKSWAGLTAVLQDLEQLCDVLGTILAEITLMGLYTQPIEDVLEGLTEVATYQTSSVRLQRRAITGSKLRVASRYVREAVALLRPHLGNAGAPLGCLSSSYIKFCRVIHGDTAWIQQSLPLIKQAAAVRL